MFALNISMKAARSEALTVMDAITFIILVTVSAIEQTHILLTTAEAAYVNVVIVQQFQIEITKRSRAAQHSMSLMPIAAAGHDHGEVITGVVRGIAKVAAHHHGGVVEQRPFAFFDLIHFKKELVKVF